MQLVLFYCFNKLILSVIILLISLIMEVEFMAELELIILLYRFNFLIQFGKLALYLKAIGALSLYKSLLMFELINILK